MMRALAALALALALPVAAQADDVRFDASQLTLCVERSANAVQCIGMAAESCMGRSAGGYSTYGMNACLSAEHAWWDDVLNTHYAALQARAQQIDSQPPMAGFPPRPSDAEALRDMQRAWIVFRDATCRFEELRWWGGTGATGAYLGCLMRLTGEQALTLQSYLAEG